VGRDVGTAQREMRDDGSIKQATSKSIRDARLCPRAPISYTAVASSQRELHDQPFWQFIRQLDNATCPQQPRVRGEARE